MPEIENLVKGWQECYPDKVKVESIGKSGGHDIWMIELTDHSIPSDHKEVALVLAMHTGMEISGGNAVFILGKWLLSDDPRARSILRKQTVVLIPCPSPYSYEKGDVAYQFRNERGRDPYSTPWSFDGVADPDVYPEAEAVRKVIDRYQPDVMIDSHGVWYEDQIMIETTGVSVFGLYKSYNRRIVETIMQEAEAAGYPQDSEDNRQALLPVGAICKPEHRHRFQRVVDGCNPAIYSYVNYHTIVMSIEVAFEESGFLRMRKLLELGNERSPLEYVDGYPNRNVNGGLLHSVTAWGRTAGERRRSRVELWNKIQHFTIGLMHPEMPGRLMYVCAMSSSAKKRVVTPAGVPKKIADFIGEMEGAEGVDIDRLRQFANPDPGYYLATQASHSSEDSYPENGLGIKVRIPYPRADLEDVSLNGNRLSISEYDGYVVWRDGNWTVLQINVPPGARLELAIVTVKYVSGDARKQGVFDI